jgi:Uma2 family endonuclease
MSVTTLQDATTPILATSSDPVPADPPRSSLLSHPYRLTVKQYDRMVEAGILGKRARVELIEGILVAKMGRNPPHVQACNKTLRELQQLIRVGWHVRKEDPIVVSDLSKPEPDLAVVRGAIDDYDHREVMGTDVALVVEIGDSTLRADQQEMKPIYAASNIPIYWIINLVDRQLEVYTEPEGGDYRKSQVFTREQDVPLILGGVEVGRIRVADLLP